MIEKDDVFEVDEATVEYFNKFKEKAQQAKGRFRDSREYKRLYSSIEQCQKLSSEIMKNKDKPGFDMGNAEKLYTAAVHELRKNAREYRSYKMKDHTLKTEKVAGKKQLNNDDRKKLDVVEDVMTNRAIMKVKKPGRSM